MPYKECIMRALMIPSFVVVLSCSSPHGLDPSRIPAERDMELDHEIAFDFNGDGVEDFIKLHPAPPKSDYHELIISLSNKREYDIIANKSLVYAFSNPGASLELLDDGSFKIMIDHSGVGRTASLREYKVSYQGGRFLLSGLTVSEYDRINPDQGGSCDLNLLTGVGERNSKAIRIKGHHRDVSSVNFEWLPNECKF